MQPVSKWLKKKLERELLKSLEIPRGALHVGFLISYIYLLTKEISTHLLTIFITIILLILLGLEISKSKNMLGKLFIKIGKPFMRSEEIKQRFTSATGTLLGLIICTTAFSKEVAMLSILFLAIGDPVSRGIRKLLHSYKVSFIYIQFLSFSGMTGVCFLISNVFSRITPLQALLAALAAASSETFLEFKLTEKLTLDDNFFIPIISGLVLTMMIWK